MRDAASSLSVPSSISGIDASIPESIGSVSDYTAPDLTQYKIDTNKISTINVEFNAPDMDKLKESLGAIQEEYNSIVKTVKGINLKEMQDQLDALSNPDNLPNIDVSELKPSVTKLNEGMKALSAAIGTLSTNVATLDSKTDGFASCICWYPADHLRLCRAYKEQRSTDYRRSDLAKNGPMLNNGIKTLQSGTTQLLSGLGTLSTQLTNGAGQLAANSGTLRDGAKNAEVRYKRAGKRREEARFPEQASCLTVQTHWNPA